MVFFKISTPEKSANGSIFFPLKNARYNVYESSSSRFLGNGYRARTVQRNRPPPVPAFRPQFECFFCFKKHEIHVNFLDEKSDQCKNFSQLRNMVRFCIGFSFEKWAEICNIDSIPRTKTFVEINAAPRGQARNSERGMISLRKVAFGLCEHGTTGTKVKTKTELSPKNSRSQKFDPFPFFGFPEKWKNGAKLPVLGRMC